MEPKNDKQKEVTKKETITKNDETITKTNIQNIPKNKKHKTRNILVLIAILVLCICLYVSYRGNYLEVSDIGEQYLGILENNLIYKYSIMVVIFIISFIAVYYTNRVIKKNLKEFFQEEKKEFPKLPNKSLSFILAIVISAITSGLFVQTTMIFFNATWFGINDPVFNSDIGFYMFQKPFFETVIFALIALVIGLAAYSFAYYIIVFNKYFDGISKDTLKKSNILKQITTSIMLIIIGIAALIIINTQGIVIDKFLQITTEDTKTYIYGAGMTDSIIKVWGYRLLSIVMIVSVFIAIQAFKQKKTKKVIISLLTVPAYLVLLFLVMFGFQMLFVGPNELDREKNYIADSIEFTKKAYGIEIDEVDVNSTGTITLEESKKYDDVLSNIPIVSSDITLSTLTALQKSTGYYAYRNATISEYNVNGKNSLIYVSPREILTNDTRSYDNKTYEYTHGYGAIVTSATKVDDNGNLVYIQKDFNDNNQSLAISEPRIYFGLETNSTIVTNSDNKKEFDYPITSTQSAEYDYNGKAGLELGFIDRLILSIKEKDIKLALSNNVTKDSKILINRNITNRAKKILPYLIYDSNPYMVVTDDGKLVWVLDAYTVSNQYPYSQKSNITYENSKNEINYIRNSVKVIIDAYDGTTDFYITDKTDPIVMAYNNMYPDLFKDIGEVPSDIAEHFAYPEFLYSIQANILKMYHNITPDVLYRGDDEWDIATYSSSATVTTGTKMNPYYTKLKVTDSETSILGLVLPYTPEEKQNLIAYLVGTTNGTEQSLKLYKFSEDSNIIGPMQLDKQLQQDEAIEKEIATINVTGTRLVKNMLVVPIENTLLYVEGLYQLPLNETQNIPTLKKVIVASGTKVAIGDNLVEALRKLLSEYATDVEVENTDTIDGLVEAIIKANNNLEESNNTNDWEQIGKDLKKLQSLITQLEELQKELEKKEKESAKTNVTNTNEIVEVNTTNVNVSDN